MSPILPEACHRTRHHVSLRLDSELSEVEEALVRPHLRRCVACRAFTQDLEALTETLRAAPLAEPSVRFQLPRRPARMRMRMAHMAAATTAITAAIAVGVVNLHSPETRIGALDIETARQRMSVKEQLLEALDTGATRERQIRFGLEAAENATLDGSQGAP